MDNLIPNPKPAVGATVYYRLPEGGRNAGDLRPAIVVRVWSDTCVNLQVFTDSDNDNLPPVVWKTSAVKGDGPGQWSPRAA